ncbi:c-type cytochrome [Rhizobium cauense]|uniref:c-type cytochrome n=1 Tax=Rhizobium cauense TaxID=1166683 RepID=UPI001C6E687E|nr:c-type cytochrome [Rhizobium cauense]MBW9117693.1 c-type cytochrome [Rhizobium cauense]
MKMNWKRVLVALSALAAAALLFAFSGFLHVRASTGHWRITDWFLHQVMRSSVRTAALGIQSPPFKPGMLPMAAGHYEVGCAGCHGSPVMPRPAAATRMLPPPPDLKNIAADWTDAQLFEIVRHGVRYTGMPAWPAPEREDEVWAMVAFIRQYSQMDSILYRKLSGFAASQSSQFNAILLACKGCHSSDRLDIDSLIPSLDGQSEAYLRDSLEAFVGGQRPSGIMQAALSLTSPEDRGRLAAYFAASGVTAAPRSQTLEAGRLLAERRDNGRNVPACIACHDTKAANKAYPRLAGQPSAYIENQLRLFKTGSRGGGPYQEIMTKAAASLSNDDILALARYYSSLPRN